MKWAVLTLRSPDNCKVRGKCCKLNRNRPVGSKEEILSLSWLAEVVYLTIFRKIKQQRSKQRAQKWLGVWEFAGCIYCMSIKNSIYRDTKLSKFQFVDMAP